MPRLKRDIYSIVNARRIYGSKDEEVEILVSRDGIHAVRSSGGQTFHVTDEELYDPQTSSIPETTQPEIQPEKTPPAAARETKVKKPAAPKKRKSQIDIFNH